MRRPHLNIRGKLILSISLPLLVTYLGLLAWDYHRQRNLTMALLQQQALERAEGTAATLDARLSSVVQVTNSLAALLESPANRNERQLRAALFGALRNPFVASATITLQLEATSPATSFTARRGDGPFSPGRDRDRDRALVESIPPEWHARFATSNTAGWTDPYELPDHDGGARSAQACTYVVPIHSEAGVAPGTAALTIIPAELRRFRGGGMRGPRGFTPGGEPFGGRQFGPPPSSRDGSRDRDGPPRVASDLPDTREARRPPDFRPLPTSQPDEPRRDAR